MIGACIAIAIMAAAIFALIERLVGKQRELDKKRDLLLSARQEAEGEHQSAQRGFKSREREIDELKKQIEQLQGREKQQAKLRSEHEDAFDQIFAIVQKHARPF